MLGIQRSCTSGLVLVWLCQTRASKGKSHRWHVHRNWCSIAVTAALKGGGDCLYIATAGGPYPRELDRTLGETVPYILCIRSTVLFPAGAFHLAGM